MVYEAIDSITSQWLKGCSPILREAFGWIEAMPRCPDQGIYELHGKSFYVNVHGYDTLQLDQCLWESHRHTVDIQYCISGGEMVEWMQQADLPRSGDYSPAKDTEKWLDQAGNRVALSMHPGFFALFLPHELHRPKIYDGTNPHVEKLVVKINAELLEI